MLNPFYPLLNGAGLSARTVAQSQILLPYPQFTGMAATTNQGYSWYHGWQSRIKRRFSDSFMFQFSYTFSKLTEANSYRNAGDAMRYRTISANDRPRHIGLMAIYELPFGRGHALLSGVAVPVREAVSGWERSAVWNVWRYQFGIKAIF